MLPALPAGGLHPFRCHQQGKRRQCFIPAPTIHLMLGDPHQEDAAVVFPTSVDVPAGGDVGPRVEVVYVMCPRMGSGMEDVAMKGINLVAETLRRLIDVFEGHEEVFHDYTSPPLSTSFLRRYTSTFHTIVCFPFPL